MKLRLVVLTLLAVGCSAPKPVPPPVVQPPAAPPNPVIVTPPVVPGRVFDESLLRGREFLLEAGALSVPQVRDPVVGPLSADQDVVHTVQALFRGAALGELDPAGLVPRWAGYLQGWARRAKAEGLGPGTVRVGRTLKEDGDGLMVPVRIFGGEKDFSGWVLLARDGPGLLVSDVQVVASVPRAGPLDPESPDQPISSPSRR